MFHNSMTCYLFMKDNVGWAFWCPRIPASWSQLPSLHAFLSSCLLGLVIPFSSPLLLLSYLLKNLTKIHLLNELLLKWSLAHNNLSHLCILIVFYVCVPVTHSKVCSSWFSLQLFLCRTSNRVAETCHLLVVWSRANDFFYLKSHFSPLLNRGKNPYCEN